MDKKGNKINGRYLAIVILCAAIAATGIFIYTISDAGDDNPALSLPPILMNKDHKKIPAPAANLSAAKPGGQTAVATPTEIVIYQPHRDGATQYKTVAGDCWGGSEVANRTDAYRCISGNQISDPCFVLPDERLLICGVDIATGTGGFLLQPEKELPEGKLWPNNIQGWAIQFQLGSGEICGFVGGATGVNAQNQRLNYDCGSSDLSTVVYGDLVVGTVWKANVSKIKPDASANGWKTISTKTVDIAKVWQ